MNRIRRIDSRCETDQDAIPSFVRVVNRRLFAILAIFFLALVLIRVVGTDVLDLDEAEQAFCSQTLALGYGPQPPLYSWLQYFTVQLLGKNVLAIIALKAALLFALFAIVCRTTQQLSAHPSACLAGVASLFLMPQIFWESVRDLSHSILVTLAAAGVWNTLIGAQGRKPWLVGLQLGGWVAIGVLAKANFLIFLATLLIAWVLHPPARRAIHPTSWIISLCVGGLLSLPYWLWCLHHPAIAFNSAEKLEAILPLASLPRMGQGLFNFIKAASTHLGLLFLFWFVVGGKQLRMRYQLTSDPRLQLLLRQLMLSLAVLFLFCTLTGAIGFRDRWLMPICISAPIFLAAIGVQVLAPRRLMILTAWIFLVMLGVTTATSLRLNVPELFGQQRLALPVHLAAGVLKELDPSIDLVITDNTWLAGNICFSKFRFDTAVINRPFLVPISGRRAFVVWIIEQDTEPPASLREFLTQHAFQEDWSKDMQILRLRAAPRKSSMKSEQAVLRLGVIRVRLR